MSSRRIAVGLEVNPRETIASAVGAGRSLLQSSIVAEVARGDEVVAAGAATRRWVLLDIELPGQNGLSVDSGLAADAMRLGQSSLSVRER
jgi:CheY-like chemotaxis protein